MLFRFSKLVPIINIYKQITSIFVNSVLVPCVTHRVMFKHLIYLKSKKNLIRKSTKLQTYDKIEHAQDVS